jgi:hypothetical protein
MFAEKLRHQASIEIDPTPRASAYDQSNRLAFEILLALGCPSRRPSRAHPERRNQIQKLSCSS